ncbi:MAG: HigA family addiction module antitoxin [Beijerinckiaceae bacterium]
MAKIRIRTHPGEVLREEFLIPLGMSATALAKEIDVPANRISDVIRERRGMTADTAIRLGRYFGTTPDLWLGLQTAHDLSKALAEGEKYKKIAPRDAA